MALETEPVLENYLIEIKEEPLDENEDFPEKGPEKPKTEHNKNEDDPVQFYLFEDGDLLRIKNQNKPYKLIHGDNDQEELDLSSDDEPGPDRIDNLDQSIEKPVEIEPAEAVAKTDTEIVETEKKAGNCWRCPLCPKKFTKELTYNAHLRVHKGLKPFECSECGQTVSTKGSLDQHMLIHTVGKGARKNRRVDCEVCGKNLEARGLKLHMLIHSGEKPLECHICLKRFNIQSNLNRHVLWHSKPKVNKKCEMCGKEFRLQVQLDDHMLIHGAEMKFKCDKCEEKFSTSRRLKVHMVKHQENVEYSCKYCSEKFSTARLLKDHRDTEHVVDLEENLANNSFLCDFCGKKLLTKNAIIAHRNAHESKKPYKCDYCDKAFAASTYLMFHMRCHDNYKPYKCSYCDKSFGHKQSLQSHERKHTGERPYSCKYCSRSFAQSYTLITHERKHSGHKPFQCQNCDKAFSQSISLSNHNKKYCTVVFPKVKKPKAPPPEKPKRKYVWKNKEQTMTKRKPKKDTKLDDCINSSKDFVEETQLQVPHPIVTISSLPAINSESEYVAPCEVSQMENTPEDHNHLATFQNQTYNDQLVHMPENPGGIPSLVSNQFQTTNNSNPTYIVLSVNNNMLPHDMPR